MGATELFLAEREALCETLETVGPEAPTLCEGWLTADLAAHLVVRERRPDASIGILLPGPFALHTEKVMAGEKEKGWDHLLARLRARPPLLHRTALAAANVGEWWVHHEDVRRAAGSVPRPLEPELDAHLWKGLALSARMNGRRVKGAGLVLRTPDGRERIVSRNEPRVTILGDPGELALFMAGRKEAAVVQHDGPPEAVALVLAARFGV